MTVNKSFNINTNSTCAFIQYRKLGTVVEQSSHLPKKERTTSNKRTKPILLWGKCRKKRNIKINSVIGESGLQGRGWRRVRGEGRLENGVRRILRKKCRGKYRIHPLKEPKFT